MHLKSKVVIVTGASSGIGLATAKLLGKHGAKIVLAARSKNKLEAISKELPDSLVIPTDMTKENEIKEMVEKTKNHLGRIDILINNAGQGYDAAVEIIRPAVYRALFDLNVLGPLVAMQQVIPIMKSQGGGTIVNISSGSALRFLPKMSPYSSLKRALVGLTLTAREELKSDNIKVSVVYPYVTLTNFEENTIKEDEPKAGSKEDFSGLPHPPDTAEYVADKILYAIESAEAEIFAHDWMREVR